MLEMSVQHLSGHFTRCGSRLGKSSALRAVSAGDNLSCEGARGIRFFLEELIGYRGG